MRTRNRCIPAVAGLMILLFAVNGLGQQVPAPVQLSLKRAVMLAVQNSRDLALARIQQVIAQRETGVERSEFRPNLYTGSGAAYTNGFPLTPGGGVPTVFNLTYNQALFDGPARGRLHAAEERAKSQSLEVDKVRDAVIVRTASDYLELAKLRHSLELLRRERESAQKIVEITRERLTAGLELPVELTRAQLAAVRVEQRIVELEGREEVVEGELRNQMGLPANQPLEVAPEQLPAGAEQTLRDLIAQAMTNSVDLQQAEAERRASQAELRGQKLGRFPTVSLVGEYSILSRSNNYTDFFLKFQRHNVNFGIQLQIPLFSARTSAAISLAQTRLNAAELSLDNKRAELSLEVRSQARHARALELGHEAARLELQLAQQDLQTLQAQFEEGRASLRDIEKARLEENDKWLAFLDAEFAQQKAQLELLRSTGQVARIFQ